MCLAQQHVSATHIQKKLLEVTLYNCRITTQLDEAKDPSKRYKLITFKPQVLYHIHAIYYIPFQVRHNLWLLTDIRFPIIKLFVFPKKKKKKTCIAQSAARLKLMKLLFHLILKEVRPQQTDKQKTTSEPRFHCSTPPNAERNTPQTLISTNLDIRVFGFVQKMVAP